MNQHYPARQFRKSHAIRLFRSSRPSVFPFQLSVDLSRPCREDPNLVGTLNLLLFNIPTFKPANLPTFGFPYLLRSSVSRNSFVCHSYENCRVCTNNSQNGTDRLRPERNSHESRDLLLNDYLLRSAALSTEHG